MQWDCNNINDPYAKLCVPDVVKNINLKVFNMISWSNQTKQIRWHESCKCECKLSICNNKQKWNKDKCNCECNKINKCDKEFIWNPCNCNCEYRKKVAHLLVEECTENIDENDNKTLSIKNARKILVNHLLLHLFCFY